jgi:hypothetical protein
VKKFGTWLAPEKAKPAPASDRSIICISQNSI